MTLIIVAVVLFGFILMRITGVSANLMSLGAIDFGIVVDGSIVIDDDYSKLASTDNVTLNIVE